MIIAPLVFSTLVVGIAGTGDLKAMGRIGIKALVYFEVATTIALVLGLAARQYLQTRRRSLGARLRTRPLLAALPQSPPACMGHLSARISHVGR